MGLHLARHPLLQNAPPAQRTLPSSSCWPPRCGPPRQPWVLGGQSAWRPLRVALYKVMLLTLWGCLSHFHRNLLNLLCSVLCSVLLHVWGRAGCYRCCMQKFRSAKVPCSQWRGDSDVLNVTSRFTWGSFPGMKRSSVLSRLSLRWAVVHLLMSTRHLEMLVAIWVSEGETSEDSLFRECLTSWLKVAICMNHGFLLITDPFGQ